MPRIKLIVTGAMERRALHTSLKRFFPERRDGEEVIWDEPRKVPGGATTNPLSPEKLPDAAMLALAQAMLDEVGIGKRGTPADHGARALSTLDWAIVPKAPPEAPFARSLFEDLAEWFWLPASPLGHGAVTLFPTKKNVRRDELLLRNL